MSRALLLSLLILTASARAGTTDKPVFDHIELAEQVLRQAENLTQSFALLH